MDSERDPDDQVHTMCGCVAGPDDQNTFGHYDTQPTVCAFISRYHKQEDEAIFLVSLVKFIAEKMVATKEKMSSRQNNYTPLKVLRTPRP